VTSPSTARARRAALVVAHPGHELRVHGWLRQSGPLVFVLTDGSGGSAQSRLASTRRIVRDAGAAEGSIFGRFSDREVYAAMMRGEARFFTALADELADGFVAAAIDVVVCDAREGYNSAHDVCWFLVEAAVAIASHRRRRSVTALEFPLVGGPDPAAGNGDAGLRLTLDDEALERKLNAAANYPEMAAEVRAAVERFTAAAFRVECLTHAGHEIGRDFQPDEVPYYERYGEQQVAAGLYADVLRQREHMVPLVTALRRHARTRTR
jgi:hypothetical protein